MLVRRPSLKPRFERGYVSSSLFPQSRSQRVKVRARLKFPFPPRSRSSKLHGNQHSSLWIDPRVTVEVSYADVLLEQVGDPVLHGMHVRRLLSSHPVERSAGTEAAA